jgi:hypothetical protein
MKITLLSCFCSLALAIPTPGQTPTPSPDSAMAAASPFASATAGVPATPPIATASMTPIATATLAPSIVATPSIAPTATPDTDEEFDKAIKKKINQHFKVAVDGHRVDEDVPWIAIPIVLIVFLTIFGLPVAVVGLILYFSFSKSRALHKTVRLMVEKGQPVPEALLNPPPVIRQRSDLRRGVVLLMVGAGLMVFFGAVNDWEGGAWSLGIIPFLIGLGYLLVWRLDVRREDSSPKV